nr:hypothetical protein [Corynebacterium lactis]
MVFPAPTTDRQTFLEKIEARREAKYLKRVEQMSGWLPGWRNQSGRRKLVVAFLASLVLLLLSGIALIFALADILPYWVTLAWSAVSLLMIAVWTCLNITVDMIDSAPLSLLDEYQQDQILGLRALTYRCYTYFGLVFFVSLIFVGTYVMTEKPSWGSYIPYGFGIFGIVAFLFISTLPTVVYAWNLRDD